MIEGPQLKTFIFVVTAAVVVTVKTQLTVVPIYIFQSITTDSDGSRIEKLKNPLLDPETLLNCW